MDPTLADVPIDVIARSPYYFLSRDDGGYALWSIRSDADEPVLTFPASDSGLASGRSAFRRETRSARWSKVLLVVAFVTGAVCIVTTALRQGLFYSNRDGVDLFSHDPVTALYTWAYVLSQIAYSTFVIAVGLFVVLWLHRRFRREG